MTYNELRLLQYKVNGDLFPYIDDWKRNPYTFFKSRLYTEGSAVLIFLLLKTRIAPNAVTLAYAFLGVLGGVLLAVPLRASVILAVCIFFFKGILDWSDGHYARLINKASLTGSVLDPYASVLGIVAFQMGLGFYAAEKTGLVMFCYLVPLIPLLVFGNLAIFSQYVLFVEQVNPESLRRCVSVPEAAAGKMGSPAYKDLKGAYARVYAAVDNFLDDRARTVDFICLVLILELFTSLTIAWLIFLVIVVKRALIFSANFYLIARGGWVEKKLQEKARAINEQLKR